MKKSKLYLGLISVLLVIGLVLSGCSNTTGSSSGDNSGNNQNETPKQFVMNDIPASDQAVGIEVYTASADTSTMKAVIASKHVAGNDSALGGGHPNSTDMLDYATQGKWVETGDFFVVMVWKDEFYKYKDGTVHFENGTATVSFNDFINNKIPPV